MKKIFILALLVTAACSVGAQKTVYDPNVEVRSAGSFHTVKVSGGIDLYLSAGEEAVAVSAKDLAYRAHIKTEVRDGVLMIWYEWKDGRNILVGSNKQLKAYVSYKTLKALSASGGSDVIVDGWIKSSKLDVNVSGGSDFKGAVEVDDLKVNASGGSDVAISGKAETVEVDASGGSDFNGFDLSAQTVNISASGGSDAEIAVSKDITARASGGSDIRYRGTATVTNTNTSGSSSVKKVGK
jgi:hypothetical protein